MMRVLLFLFICIFPNLLKAEIDLCEFNYSKVDWMMEEQEPETPVELTDFINKNFKTEHEKFRAIYMWVCAVN
jgi:hypothetical protein